MEEKKIKKEEDEISFQKTLFLISKLKNSLSVLDVIFFSKKIFLFD